MKHFLYIKLWYTNQCKNSDESWYFNTDQPQGDSNLVTKKIFLIWYSENWKFALKWQHTEPHLKKILQSFAVNIFEILIYINLKATVDKPEGDSDLITKNLLLSQYREN